jgi:proton glutamate symport protein
LTDTVKQAGRNFAAYWALLALIAGLAAGAMADVFPQGLREGLLSTASFVGGLWLNALKMTVIPLVVTLLVVGIAKSREAAAAGRIAGRSVMWIVIFCTASAVFGALMVLLLTHLFPLPRGTAESLQAALAGIEQPSTAALPSIVDFFKGVIPDNVVAAASNGDVLPLVVFAVMFALALAKISAAGRRSIVGLFEAIADALLVIIGWVLWIAPLGVFALAFTVGAAAGGAAFAGLGHYIVLISAIGVLLTIAAYPIAILLGRVRPGLFARAMIGPQAVAI